MTATERAIAEYIAALRMVRTLDATLAAEVGVSFVQAVVLLRIAGGDTRPKAISEALVMPTQSVTGNLDRLERDGFVLRRRDGVGDRRGVALELTPKARGMLPALRRAIEAAAAEAVPA